LHRVRRSSADASVALVRVLVNIDVDDLPRATAFYVDGLGLAVGRRFGGGGIELLGGGVAFYLLVKRAGTQAAHGAAQVRDYARHWTPVHLDFVVEDLEAAKARAIAAGAVLERDIEHHDWGSIAGFSDPFGHGFCLLRFTERGYDAIATATATATA
jgi:predicted enzyme related to lactoylglutathione lyase